VILARINGYKLPYGRQVILAKNIGEMPSGRQALLTKNIV
jgi:hypothetical protein